ncbi:MBL fold metallo-hydrolase [Vibrio sp. EJY3]|uniref:MBL fold metallo-hydrolase n=1 Tax=Vibrio sp. (strain EJY3) TaxID=1116375 RepID=UPI000243B3FB|nr:MBL fold metallo-hydrolase [Vibrio sp. EJY3]AEX22511.1 beta-lactamase [Vibrio sp. EJY3]
MKSVTFIFLGILVVGMLASLASNKQKFYNSEMRYSSTLGDTVKIVHAFLTAKRVDAVPKTPLLNYEINPNDLRQPKSDFLYRLGHSSVLMHIDSNWILTDPVFSERASPIQWAGPKRFHPAPITANSLPYIDIVIISHDHYDHLDKATIKAIDEKVGVFVTPLKVGDRLQSWGISREKIIQLDWWQSVSLNNIELVSTPSQHFSGRGLLDRNQTLWSSWVILGSKHRIFFSGDSGYFSGFKSIGERYGPFDFTLMEAGAYNSLWSDIHMVPEESVQAHIDLQGKFMIPIHNGTFDLSMHPWYEPLERISAITANRGVQLVTPAFGEQVVLDAPSRKNRWWLEQSANSNLEIAQF